MWEVPRLRETWIDFVHEDDVIAFDEEETDSEKETRLTKMMGSLMIDFNLNLVNIAKGIDHFVQ